MGLIGKIVLFIFLLAVAAISIVTVFSQFYPEGALRELSGDAAEIVIISVSAAILIGIAIGIIIKK